MAYEVNNLSGYFIATVKGYNTITRELDVFIPKLMPAIPDGQKTISSRTNLGAQIINIPYNRQIKTKSSIKVKAEDTEVQLPEVGSHVLVYFLDEQYSFGLWRRFNVNSDFNIIESEKYKKYFNINIGGSVFKVSQDDTINIELPKGYKTVLVENGKTKTILISENNDIETRLSELERKVGNNSGISKIIDNNGEIRQETILASGIMKEIESLRKQIEDLQNKGV